MKKNWGKILFVLFMGLVGVVKYDEKYPIVNPFAKLQPIKGVDIKIAVPDSFKAGGVGFRRDWIGDDALGKPVGVILTNRTGGQYWRLTWVDMTNKP